MKTTPLADLYLAHFIFLFPNFNIYKKSGNLFFVFVFLCSPNSIYFARVLNPSTANRDTNSYNKRLIHMKLLKFNNFFKPTQTTEITT